MPISTELNCLFLHIPKTAGTSVEKALGMFGDWRTENRDSLFGMVQSRDLLQHSFQSAFLQHLTYSETEQLLGSRRLRSIFSFAFVRNPWDRVVSSFSNPDPHLVSQAEEAGLRLKGLSFNDFVAAIGHLDHCHLMPQHRYVFDELGRQQVDFLGRFENIHEDFLKISTRLGLELELPHENPSDRLDYRKYYDGDTIQRVAQMYHRDIEYFGYCY